MKRCQGCKHSEAVEFDPALDLVNCRWGIDKLPESMRWAERERVLVDDTAAETCVCYEEKVKG
jgi:hypothetical protein